MIARCIALGLPIDSVPIRTIYAGEPSHIRPWRHFTEFVRVTRKARRIAHGGGDSGGVLAGTPKYGLVDPPRTHTFRLEAGRTLPLATPGDRTAEKCPELRQPTPWHRWP